MRIGSLFSGIGGLELGLETALNGEVVWQVEQSPFCRDVLAKHYPDARRYNDVREVGEQNLAPVDLICGGFPCQDISLAGLGRGLAGEKSGLWWEFDRIIGEMGPRYVVLENVAALANRGLDAILGALSSRGYNAVWDIISAQACGAWHRRDRMFIVAYPDSISLRIEPEREESGRFDVQAEGEAVAAHHGSEGEVAFAPNPDSQGELQSQRIVKEVGGRSAHGSGEAGGATAPNPDNPGCNEQRGAGTSQKEEPAPEFYSWWATEPDVGRVAHGVPRRVDRLRALGNACVPQVSYIVGLYIKQLTEKGF